MGLTADSSGINVLKEDFNLEFDHEHTVVALAGNPNTGKSTVFNGLTGLRQHTGNWPGKTVTQAQGVFTYKGQDFMVVDLPGTYSLLSNSTEERVARDFICFAQPDATIVVTDATNLERNLNLVLQVMELTENVVLCVNLMDEAARKNIHIDISGLKQDLKIPVIPTIARDGKGLNEIKDVVYQISNNLISVHPTKITYSEKVEEAVDIIVPILESNIDEASTNVNLRWLALRLLEGDKTILKSIEKYNLNINNNIKGILERGVQTNGVS